MVLFVQQRLWQKSNHQLTTTPCCCNPVSHICERETAQEHIRHKAATFSLSSAEQTYPNLIKSTVAAQELAPTGWYSSHGKHQIPSEKHFHTQPVCFSNWCKATAGMRLNSSLNNVSLAPSSYVNLPLLL